MKQFLMYAVIIMLLSATDPLPGYTISGTAPGLKDSTWLFLSEGSKESRFDSCMVLGGRFRMQGRITDAVRSAILNVGSKFLNYKGFWLQNTDITITCKDSMLKESVVAGSPMDDDAKDIQAFAGGNAQLRQEWIKQHPNSLISALTLRFNAEKWGKQTTKALYDQLSATVKQSKFGQGIKDYLELAGNVAVGDRFVDFEQPDTKGSIKKFSQLKGKYTLLEFWSSMCGPCIEGHPKLINTYNKFKEKGFAIVGVSLDFNQKTWLKALTKDKLPWENLCDLRGSDNKAAVIYGVNAMPSNFLIDEKGIVIAKDLRDDALDKKLQELLP